MLSIVVSVQQLRSGLCLLIDWMHACSRGGLTVQRPLLLAEFLG